MEKKEILEAIQNEINFMEAANCTNNAQRDYMSGAINGLKMIKAKLDVMLTAEETKQNEN